MSDHAIEQGHGRAHQAHAIAEDHHPGPVTYIVIAVVLTVLTAFEIGVFYAPALQPILVPLLIVLAILKFILVAGYYMHLHFDSRVFSVLFVFPLLLAVFICMSLLMLFEYLANHPG